ncbi:hypothetical protein [Loktanella salsilacus]|uniref:hypothetical protein n=1 Tax=Loktanella salsilacus TaxID=195913 RepID=UPI00158763B5|nr:hypothetical protein [Loktanella salsilacus]
MKEKTIATASVSPNPVVKPTGFAWAKKLMLKAGKPKPFSVVSAKRAMQLVAGQGKEPAALKVEPDGSFTIELVQAGKPATAPAENPWDTVL